MTNPQDAQGEPGQGEWAAREFTDKERNRWLARKGEFDWLLISPDCVKFGPLMEATARGLCSMLCAGAIYESDNASLRREVELALAGGRALFTRMEAAETALAAAEKRAEDAERARQRINDSEQTLQLVVIPRMAAASAELLTRAKAAEAALVELKANLAALEWHREEDEEVGFCGWCGAGEDLGHESDCAFAALATVQEQEEGA
jgi:hypothetical protein